MMARLGSVIAYCAGEGSSACVDLRLGAIARAAEVIKSGELIVFPTDTVYGLGADAFNPAAVQRLLDAKNRGRAMPSPVLAATAAAAFALASNVPEGAMALADAFWPGALTLVLPVRAELKLNLGDKSDTIALRVPDDRFARELLRATGPLAVSSANLSGEPSALDCPSAREMLGEAVSLYLDGGPVSGGVASTIIDFSTDEAGVLQRAGAISLEQIQSVLPGVRLAESHV
ncbi:MAG: threonylcarbamoyl-AMP synthase [Propionibacteriaceae bacterium]|jgi:tRNA threonylcarbamoyl adenosine modification protein (Sua5/YciO/YrdC/YwlC family)|nr:threonylcarbamoyl-AMP synthase [Propionibacteriaceae bacterium]